MEGVTPLQTTPRQRHRRRIHGPKPRGWYYNMYGHLIFFDPPPPFPKSLDPPLTILIKLQTKIKIISPFWSISSAVNLNFLQLVPIEIPTICWYKIYMTTKSHIEVINQNFNHSNNISLWIFILRIKGADQQIVTFLNTMIINANCWNTLLYHMFKRCLWTPFLPETMLCN